MAAPARRRRPARTRRPARKPRRPTVRRRARQAATNRLLAAAFALALAIAAFREYPVTSSLLTALVLAAAAVYFLVSTGHLRLLTRPATSRADCTHAIAAYQHLTGPQFEHAIADLARRDPTVRTATVSGGSNDRALDVLVQLTDGRRIAIQCKRHAPKNRVGAPVIYAVNGTYRAYHRCDQAVIVTTSSFTPDAQRANAELDHPLRLIDGRALARWVSGGRPPWGA
ncbi:restriction endonuclease [Streptomyces decoyicus]|uniref:restriction endonuclease n=1 Tax=Streptomyces decoyicus TaxID=249567 RepID=UPI0004AA3511|nr:restriction endonuclease [Streptomyces decoyicus]KOG41193.1 restriction endonuclease [Streptomyces decoyicus]QZY20095.1 restriction endonuclease [Streptomyces decoyicus]